MNIAANPRIIGLFALGGIVLTIVLLMMFGNGSLLSDSKRYVAYFEGSVNGLNIGASVKIKGVSIGRVSQVLVEYDEDNNRVLTPVVLDVDLKKVLDTRRARENGSVTNIESLIDKGLRARLGLQSLVTNQLYIEFDFLPETPAQLLGQKNNELPEIPTVGSNKDELEKTVQTVARKVKDLPIQETMDTTLALLHRVEALAEKPETSESIENLNKTLAEMKTLMKRLDGVSVEGGILMKRLNQEVPPLLVTAGETLKQTRSTMSSFGDLTSPGSDHATALHELARGSQSLRHLAESLERHPDQLLYGRSGETGPRK